MDKLSVKDAQAIRKTLYDTTVGALETAGYETEPIKNGSLIHLGNGYFAKMAISICDATKFDLETTRAEYQEKLENARVAAEKAALKAVEEEAKAAAKAVKAAEKAAKASKE